MQTKENQEVRDTLSRLNQVFARWEQDPAEEAAALRGAMVSASHMIQRREAAGQVDGDVRLLRDQLTVVREMKQMVEQRRR
jgi:hypothetical protein